MDKSLFQAHNSLPGELPKKKKTHAWQPTQKPCHKLTEADVKAIIGKNKKDLHVDLNGAHFKLESDEFLKYFPDNVKFLDMGGNSLGKFQCTDTLSKLKYLSLENSNLTEINLSGLKSLVGLNLSRNRFQAVPDFSSQELLQYLDLSGNRLETGFQKLKKCVSLRVLDMGDCKLSFDFIEFKKVLFDHLRPIQKLQYLAIKNNPVADIPELRLYILRELPEMKVLDWTNVTKEERIKAQDEGLENRILSNETPKSGLPKRMGEGRNLTKKNSLRFNDLAAKMQTTTTTSSTTTSKAPSIKVLEKQTLKHDIKVEPEGGKPTELAPISELFAASEESDDDIKDLDTGKISESASNVDIDFAQLMNSLDATLPSDFGTASTQLPESEPEKISQVKLEGVSISAKSMEDLELKQLLSSMHTHIQSPPGSHRAAETERPLWDLDVSSIKFQKGLGQGSFGGTFLATWSTSQGSKPITVKKLLSKSPASLQYTEKFKEEVRKMMQISHPNLAPVLGACTMGAHYVLYDNLPGPSLFEYLKRSSPTPLEILYIARSLASAIGYLHQYGLVHGSLKSKNIFIHTQDQDARTDIPCKSVIVKDYGFLDVKLDVPVEKISPEYMAPEMLSGQGGVTSKIDVHSFGMLLFALVNGSEPYEGMPKSEVMICVKNRKLPEMPSWPPALVRLIQNTLSSTPDIRPTFQDIISYLSANNEELFPSPQQEVLSTTVVQDIDRFVRESVLQRALNEPRELTATSVPSIEGVEKETRVKVRGVLPLSVGVDVKSEEKKLHTVIDKIRDMMLGDQTSVQQKAVATIAQVMNSEERVYYVALAQTDLLTALLSPLVHLDKVGKYEVAVKVVSLLKDLARHLIVAEKLGVTANFKILLGAVAAKSTREEDTTIIEEIITTLRLFATTLPSTIEDMIESGLATKASDLLRAKTTLPAQKIPVTRLIEVLAEDPDNRDTFIEDGLVDFLFDMYDETRIPQLKLHIMEAMANFLYHDSLASDPRLLAMDLSSKAFKMAKSEKAMLRNSGFRCLCKLCQYEENLSNSEIEEATTIFVCFLKGLKWKEIGSIPLLYISPEEEQQWLNILTAIKSLALLGEREIARETILSSNFLSVLISLLTHVPATTLLWPSLELLGLLLSSHCDIIPKFKEKGGIKLLSQFVGSYDGRIREKALRSLVVIASEDLLSLDWAEKKRKEENQEELEADRWTELMGRIASIISFSNDIDEYLPAAELCNVLLSGLESREYLVVSDSMCLSGAVGGFLRLLPKIRVGKESSSSSGSVSESDDSSEEWTEGESCLLKVVDTLYQISTTERGAKTIIQSKKVNNLLCHANPDLSSHSKIPEKIWSAIISTYLNLQKCGREGKSKNGWESEITTFFSLLPISSLDTKQKILKLFKRIKEEDAAHIKAILELLGDTTLINSL